MSNLTTRKIVLGLLMVLVLTFSVQGIADALTSLRKATDDSGDGAIIRVSSSGNTFVFTVAGTSEDDELTLTLSRGTITSPTSPLNPSNGDVTVFYNAPDTTMGITLMVSHTAKATGTSAQSQISFSATVVGDLTLTKSKNISTSRDHQTQVENRRLVNPLTFSVSNVADDDSFVIGSSGGNFGGLKIDRILIGSTEVYEASATGVDSVILMEAATSNDEKLINGTVKVYCTLGEAGDQTLTVGGLSENFMAYAVQSRTDVETSVATIAFTSPAASTLYDTDDTKETVDLTGAAASHAQVSFRITGGYFYKPELDSLTTFTTTRASNPMVTRTNVSNTAEVKFKPNNRTNVQITAQVVHKPELTAVKTYYYGDAVLDKVSGDDQTGRPNTQLRQPLVVQVENESGSGVSGQVVSFSFDAASFKFSVPDPHDDDEDDENRKTGMFLAVPGTTIYDSDNVYDDTNGRVAAANHDSIDTEQALLTVVSDSRGEAKVYVVLTYTSTDSGKHYYQPTATILKVLPADSKSPVNTEKFTHRAAMQRFKATADPEPRRDTRDIRIVSGDRQNVAVRKNADPLVVVVESDGNVVQGASVTFSENAGIGELEFVSADNFGVSISTPGSNVIVTTDANGQASVNYYVGNTSGVRKIDATIDVDPDEVTRTSVTFTINVGGARDPGSGGGDQNTILIELSSTTGEPGEEIDVRVTSDPSGESVNINSGELTDADFSGLSGTTPFTRTLVLPDEEGEYTFSATRSRFTSDSATVTVEAELGTLSITAIGSPEAGLQTFSISALDADGDRASAPFTARLSGTGFTSRNVEIAGGRGNARVTLPTTAGLYTLTVSATGYEDDSTTFRVAAGGQVDDAADDAADEPVLPPADDTGGVPDSIEITGPSTRSGTVNEALDTPLLVRVLDDDGDGLEGARVFYRVTGRGRISDGSRGGRSVGVVTDDDGYARANFTPTAGGSSTVRVNTDDVSRIVTFTITTGSAPTPRGPGTGGTPGTSVSPVVHVAAASRPPMLWVDGGAIYALVGASPQRFAASVDNALNITVGGGKVYWTEKTGESGGTINSANLNGSDVTELTSIKAVPMGIAVDVAGSKLYWTNSRGRIQSADLDGSGITNVMQNLPSPMDLALAGGNAYWTQGNGSVRFVNLRGQKVVRNVSTGTDTPGSLVIGGGKVYWTEMTGESGGTVNSANLNGTGATPLASILAAPMGIAVDGSRSKLYWSNSRGRIQSANLDGSGITNVVSGLGSPGDMVLSNSIAAPAATTTTRTTTTASNKYDVNGDGSVNNADSDAITVAIAAGATDAKYDVNGDGTVNVFDLVEIIANRDPGAAGAPTLFGMKMSAAQIDSLQEQIDLLIAMNDRSPAALRTLIYLQQLLVTARPEKTLLLANYPNPFNPETWIPYELATDTNVRLTIYNTQGVVIRSLQLGHQSAGYYTGRDRAAYWDGRNALGEQVASGLYFYQLETDEMSLMRKMVILK